MGLHDRILLATDLSARSDRALDRAVMLAKGTARNSSGRFENAMVSREMDRIRSQNVEVDRRGVDRAQIRRMLELSPLERLRWLEEFLASVVEIRRLNEKRAVR
jgi:nucleotide-binding universal stress UspA family protein